LKHRQGGKWGVCISPGPPRSDVLVGVNPELQGSNPPMGEADGVGEKEDLSELKEQIRGKRNVIIKSEIQAKKGEGY